MQLSSGICYYVQLCPRDCPSEPDNTCDTGDAWHTKCSCFIKFHHFFYIMYIDYHLTNMF